VEQNQAFDPAVAASTLLREARTGALATLKGDARAPYCSLVNVAAASNGAPILLLSNLAVHTRNLLADPRVSLMLDERKAGDPLEGARVSLAGTAARSDDPADRRRYLARHPEAAQFVDFRDFAFYRVAIAGAHLVAGFGRIVDLAPAQILTDIADAAALLEAEVEICAHLNDDHADTLRLYATRLMGAPDGAWRCVGCDPEGLDLQDGRRSLRVRFPRAVNAPGPLRQTLKQLAEQARGG
jgi:putative heme iron utilization protein